MMQCVICSEALSGRQRKYCARICKNRSSNKRNQSYVAQQERGLRRKLRLVRSMGSRRSRCGYSANLAALKFHHTEPTRKSFSLDLRALSNRKWPKVLVEARKCILVCSNCHKEIHNPRMSIALTAGGRCHQIVNPCPDEGRSWHQACIPT